MESRTVIDLLRPTISSSLTVSNTRATWIDTDSATPAGADSSRYTRRRRLCGYRARIPSRRQYVHTAIGGSSGHLCPVSRRTGGLRISTQPVFGRKIPLSSSNHPIVVTGQSHAKLATPQARKARNHTVDVRTTRSGGSKCRYELLTPDRRTDGGIAHTAVPSCGFQNPSRSHHRGHGWAPSAPLLFLPERRS